MENDAIKLLIRALEEDKTKAQPGFQIHIAHLADSGSMADIEAAKKKGAHWYCLQDVFHHSPYQSYKCRLGL